MRKNKTTSLCPVCLKRIDAEYLFEDSTVFLLKTCHTHGTFKTVVWRGEPSFESWDRPKTPAYPKTPRQTGKEGCPYDCGLCNRHRQKTCTAVIEITSRCNLNCNTCFADTEKHTAPDPTLAQISSWFESVKRYGGNCNIQLSGGEPTVRNDLPDIVDMGRKAGFEFIQINTNGIRLADDKNYVQLLKDAGLASVFLQFDGISDDVFLKIRGRKLLSKKLKAIENCGKNNIGVVLVPTLIPDINLGQIGDIIRTAKDHSPVVRAVHFQPVSYFGRYTDMVSDDRRITLPEIMLHIEKQTGGQIKTNHFKPPGCENALCSFSANFIIQTDGTIQPLHQNTGRSCCSAPSPAAEGAEKAKRYVARQWAFPEINGEKRVPVSPGMSTPPSAQINSPNGLTALDAFLRQTRLHTLSISAMAFQDVWNIDLERVRDCCIHTVAPDGRLVPFCAYNCTSASGKALHRI
ncbi:MAG: radical SAM protein [Desulfobacterales bacterium]|nr:radical SAM protein [Desulfobacterales bacterium]